MNPDTVKEQMKEIEAHLIKFTEVNESSISLLVSQVNDLTSQIRELKKKINDVLDELERKVMIEGDQICKEEIIKKQEENHHCQRLISSIRNSHTILETVKKYGAEVFLMTEKMMSQLTSYLDQLQESYTKIETTTVLVEVNPQVQSALSAGADSLAMITSENKIQSLLVPVIRKSSRNCLVQRNRIIEIKGIHNLGSYYTGVMYLYSCNVMLADFQNSRVCLLDSSYSPIISHNLPDTFNVCVVDDDEVAVTVPSQNTVQFLSVRDGKITPTRKITTKYRCSGIASVGMGKIIVSGDSSDRDTYYWSLISRGEKEESCYKFNCQCVPSFSYVALDYSFTCVYITVIAADSLSCFHLSGSQKFVYSHGSLKNPCGVATDKYDNVFVVGFASNNIHQLTPDGVVLQIISDGVPAKPLAICFNRDGDEFLVTNVSDRRKLYKYRLK